MALLLVAVATVAVVLTMIYRADAPEAGISAEELAEGAENSLQAEAGARPAVSCPEALKAEVGATARCTLTAGDDPEEYGVAVTVTSVDGDTFTVDVQVDEEPLE